MPLSWGIAPKMPNISMAKNVCARLIAGCGFLRKRLEALTVVDRKPANADKVYFGAWIELEDDAEELYRYRIVGEDEIDLKRGYISVDAPLARGLMGKALEEEVEVMLPKGLETYYVIAIAYDKPAWDTGEPPMHRWADNH